MDIIRNEKELQQALGGNQAKIGMEGRVVAKIEPLVCANSAAWCIAMVAIATAFFDSIGATKMEAASPQRIMATEDAAGAVDILGAEATYAAISMAVAAGGRGSFGAFARLPPRKTRKQPRHLDQEVVSR
ncbi:hypothetical protein [Helicobacter ailurogastricus]|uniref:hypothetical protein n=1 Tax=Helicobacter ailurogastricus TaxID=1578720 RepID=UPI00244D86D9|nr:hypothetical protein [Helicobacter ailurogastricus]GMB92009.1 hypothetical protein NHP190009_11850 [Helicobacter ailurogastricus]